MPDRKGCAASTPLRWQLSAAKLNIYGAQPASPSSYTDNCENSLFKKSVRVCPLLLQAANFLQQSEDVIAAAAVDLKKAQCKHKYLRRPTSAKPFYIGKLCTNFRGNEAHDFLRR